MNSMFNFGTYQALFSTLTTLAHLCTCSQPFCVCVLLCPTGMAAGESLCVCVYVSALALFVCRCVAGEGVGVLGTGEINQCLAGKLPPFCPLCRPPPLSLFTAPTPNSHHSVFMPLIHVLCDDAPPAVGGCIPTQDCSGT